MANVTSVPVPTPQWNPAVKTGSTSRLCVNGTHCRHLASMEPGREDREHATTTTPNGLRGNRPQWNPAVKTGSTPHQHRRKRRSRTGLNGTRP